jgi:hypothetical protein
VFSLELPLVGLRELLAPAVVEVRYDALTAAKGRDALLAPRPLEYERKNAA